LLRREATALDKFLVVFFIRLLDCRVVRQDAPIATSQGRTFEREVAPSACCAQRLVNAHNLRVDQAWGSASIAGALHQVNAIYYRSVFTKQLEIAVTRTTSGVLRSWLACG
jgi:hypothetical protein